MSKILNADGEEQVEQGSAEHINSIAQTMFRVRAECIDWERTGITPAPDMVLYTEELPPAETVGGLVIPESAQRFDGFQKVLAVGEDVTDIKAGDRIVIGRDAPLDERYVIVCHPNIQRGQQPLVLVPRKRIVATIDIAWNDIVHSAAGVLQ